ncbi:MAG: hypothetical protein R3Y46_02230 [Opitutales bacterium]
MARNQSTKLKWCKARFGSDNNWWVYETSDKVNWDYDGISVLDPRQTVHFIETLQSLKEYGLEESLVEKAFFSFVIDSQDGEKGVKLLKTNDSVMDANEHIFLFPNNIDDETGFYAEFLTHITYLQIKMLNKTFKFEEDLTIEDLEEQLRDKFHSDYMEGKSIHAFYEIMDILEYIPEGYSLEEDELDEDNSEDKEYDEIEDLPEDEESLEEDDTMQWDEDEDEDFGDMGSMSFDDEDDRY